MAVPVAWADAFCLGCDKSTPTNEGGYCSERCRLQEQDVTGVAQGRDVSSRFCRTEFLSETTFQRPKRRGGQSSGLLNEKTA